MIEQTNWLLHTHTVKETPQGYFPDTGKFISHTPDLFIEKGYRPLFAAIAWLFHQLQWMQRGRISLYILYIAVALLALLFWFGGLR
ncbi:MAG: hydrogenase 4 subunit B [bacterium ADurb.Bin478]|nr:MAG: hydrogenase 4 subunit B [bacterium ADurb.Bin478]